MMSHDVLVDVLVIHSGWEQVPESEYLRAFNAKGLKAKVIHDFGALVNPQDYQSPTRAILSTSLGIRTLTYRKYTLWSIASYDIALRCGKPLAEILQDPVLYFEKLNASYAVTATLLDKAEDIISEIQPRPCFTTYFQRFQFKSMLFVQYLTLQSLMIMHYSLSSTQKRLEAAAMKKPVITTATSLYGGLGFSEEARNREELYHFMSKHLEKNLRRGYTGPDFRAARGFLYIFLEKFCINRSADDIADLMLK
ncbi:unnamed protein product [Bathycoccus prasinos]